MEPVASAGNSAHTNEGNTMKISTVIRPSAEVIQINEVTVGAVYKRLDTPSFGEPRLVFGVVTDIMHNGESAALVAIEFIPPAYSGSMEPTLRTFQGDAEVAIYPAQPEEFSLAMQQAIEKQERAIEEVRKNLAAKQSVLDMMERTLMSPMTVAGTVVVPIEG
jgi:hypothetical protein